MTPELRRFCIKIEPRRELELFMLLSKQGTITADESGTVLWAELPMTEAELEGVAGVLKAIEYVQPRWSDVLADGAPAAEFVR